MKKENLTPDRYIGGETINRYLNDFARDYDLVRRIRLRTHVTKVEHLDEDGWRLIIDGAPAIRADRVVYATGVSSDMYVPQIAKDNFHKPVIHSGQIGTSLESLQGPDTQRATVVGAAKSSYDTVFLLIKAGKKVDWIIREDGSGPLAIMPPRLMGVLNTVDVMATRALASFSPAILNTSGVWYKCLHKTRVGRFIVKAFWRTVAGMAESHAGYHRNANAARLRPIPYGYGFVSQTTPMSSLQVSTESSLTASSGPTLALASPASPTFGRPSTPATAPCTAPRSPRSPKRTPSR